MSGLGLVLGSSTESVVEPPLSGDAVALHVIVPTVPVPVLLDGRPQ